MLQNLVKDLRYAGRTFRQNPMFTAVAVASLALGIGVNTAIFSLIDALLLKNLPVKDPGQLMMVSEPHSAGVSIGTQTGVRNLFTYDEFQRMRQRNQVFSTMFAAESTASREKCASEGDRSKNSVRGWCLVIIFPHWVYSRLSAAHSRWTTRGAQAAIPMW
jgi:hypothetical protein